METTTMFLLALVAGLLIGAALGIWLTWRRLNGATSEHSHAAKQLREQLARAETRAELLSEQVAQERRRDDEESVIITQLGPMTQQLKDLGHHVRVLERDRQHQYGELSQQLRAAAETDSALLTNTQSLVATLRSNSARGHWGEVQLRRIVEAAGMLPNTDFTEQAHLTGEDGRKLRPDLVVHLPGDKTLAVDAKAPLSAILAAEEIANDASAEAKARRTQLVADHLKAVRAHVDQLANKRYWAALEHSPELVICFLPAESYLAAAVEADPELLDYAFAKNVALVSPVSLLTALKSVAYAWQQETLVDNAKVIFDSARQLYQRLSTVSTHINRVGSSLKTSVESYNQMIGSLETRLLPAARRIQELDPALAPLDRPTPVEATPRVISAPELQHQEPASRRSL